MRGRGRRTLKTLLTAPVTFVDADLAAFYGLPAPARRRLPARRPGSQRAPPACSTQGSFLADAREGRPDVARRCAASSCAPSCSATRRRRPRRTSSSRPPTVDPRLSTRAALRAAHRGRALRHLPPADGSDRVRASSTTTPPAAGATSTAASRSTRPATLTGTDVDGALDGVPSLAARLAAQRRGARAARRRSGSATRSAAPSSRSGDLCTIGKLAGRVQGRERRAATSGRWCAPPSRMAAFRNRPPETSP